MTPAEPWCNHDAAAVVDGVCECGARLPAPDPTIAVRIEPSTSAVGIALDILRETDFEGAGHFTCSESAAVENLLRSLGANDVADSWVLGHATGDDDCDDVHHRIYLELTGQVCD